MRKVRLFSLFLMLILLLFGANSCKNAEKYRDSATSEELAEQARATLSDCSFLSVDAEYLTDYFAFPSSANDLSIWISTNGNSLDEFGIWHTDLQNVEQARRLFSEYLSTSLDRNRVFYDSYIPQETPKLRDAEVRVYGSYVAYAVLDAPHRRLFFDTLESCLKEA